MMIGMTRVKGVTILLDADYDLDNDTATYRVTYDGTKLFFNNFRDASVLFKSLEKELEMGCDMDSRINTLVSMYGKEAA